MLRDAAATVMNRFLRSWNGYGITCSKWKKKKPHTRELVDNRILEAYLDQNRRVRLYYDAMRKADVEWSDNFPKQCRFYSIQQMVEFVLDKRVDGDFAECGCWKGHSTYIVASILSDRGFANEFHVFDSFEGGLSEKHPQDKNKLRDETTSDMTQQKQVFASSKGEVERTLAEFPFVKLYEGWIPDRFDEVEARQFCFVHVDVDLYQPTLNCLEFFYPRLSSGGVVVVDDYGYSAFPGAKRAVDEFLQRNDHQMFYEVPVGGAFFIK